MFFRMESQELSTRNINSAEMTRNELEALEKDARYALFHQKKQFQIAVREYQRQPRDAVNQAAGIFRKLPSSDDARNSKGLESIRRTTGRK